jgi:hypothetical protein
MSNNVNVIEEIGQRKPEPSIEQDRRYKNSNSRKTPSGANIIPRKESLFEQYPPPKTSNRRNGGRKYKMKQSMRIRMYNKNNKTRRVKRRRSKRI